MLRSKLKNNFKKQRSDGNWDNYKKQRNFCVKLLHQTKEKYFNDINCQKYFLQQKIMENHQTIIFNEGLNMNNMMLVEDNKIVPEEVIKANIMENYFKSMITTYLKLKPTKTGPKANLESIIDTF